MITGPPNVLVKNAATRKASGQSPKLRRRQIDRTAGNGGIDRAARLESSGWLPRLFPAKRSTRQGSIVWLSPPISWKRARRRGRHIGSVHQGLSASPHL